MWDACEISQAQQSAEKARRSRERLFQVLGRYALLIGARMLF